MSFFGDQKNLLTFQISLWEVFIKLHRIFFRREGGLYN